MSRPRLTASLLLPMLLPGLAWAQPARTGGGPGHAAPAPVAAPVAAPAAPQQTTATFGDWTLRCLRPPGASPVCEVVQAVQQDGRTVAQIAWGRVSRGQPLQLTILVPPSVSFGAGPALVPPEGEGGPAALQWRRCLPGGCIAEAEVGDDLLRRVRGWSQPARITFADAAGRGVALPLSPTGLVPALDALAKETAGPP